MGSVVLQLIVSGIAMGFIYALLAIEYTLIWNSTGLMNFSHEKVVMISAYVFAGTYVLGLGLDVLPSLVLAMLTMLLFGLLMAVVIFIPLRNKTRLITAVATMVLGKLLIEATRLVWTPKAFTLPGFLTGHVRFGGVSIPVANLVIIAASIVVVAALLLFMKKTRIGKAMRCVQQNKNAAALMGIQVERNMAITIGISAMICCIAGVCIIPLYPVEANMANILGLKGFAAGIIGGFGNIPAAIMGGLLLGLLENAAVMIFPSVFKDIVSFVLLILVLLIKPEGLMMRTKT